MPRNLVLCCDGTNNEFGTENTNVVRLMQMLDQAPQTQVVQALDAAAPPGPRQLPYYDPGVGTLPEPGIMTSIGKKISQLLGLAFGAGLDRNVEDAYDFLMRFWEPGDRVFLFGFSRGAYTVRVLAGVLHQMGLLPRGHQNLIPYVLRLFSAIGDNDDGGGKQAYWKLCDEFRWSFARPRHDGDDSRRFPVHFLGVWDTVSSVGWAWDPVRYPFTARNPSISIIRHAVALDERRAFYRQNLMLKGSGNQDLQEAWFPGVHSDVGGGYPEDEGGLWRPPLEWLVDEASKFGLGVDAERRRTVLTRTPPPDKPWAERQHESLTPLWWIAEFFPKVRRTANSKWRLPRINLGRRRTIKAGTLLHRATLLRIRNTSYAPPNLSPRFLEQVRSLTEVPELLAYEP